MNTKQRIAMIFVLLLSLVISSCAPGQIFGPTATPTPTPTLTPTLTPMPPLVLLGTPPIPVKMLDAYVTMADVNFNENANDFSTDKIKQKTLPAIFPSETAQLILAVMFDGSLPNNTSIDMKVSANNEIVNINCNWVLVAAYDSTGLTKQTAYAVFEPISGKFVDGSYQATLSINGNATAVLNWIVGTAK